MPQSIANSRWQTIISYVVISVLILIAAAIIAKQQFYKKSTAEELIADNLFGRDFYPIGETEIYNADNLYEKIDGKADLYLSNGFVSLECRRFASKTSKDLWAEIYLYDMATAENAFAVYSLQKREESKALDWTETGYSTDDAIYVASGRYYIEIVISLQDAALLSATQSAAKNFASSISTSQSRIQIFRFFPAEYLIKDSFKFIKADAFGADCLKDIFTAAYKINEDTITAYLSRTSPAETFAKYRQFLLENGAKELQMANKLPRYCVVEIFGTNEIFFVVGDYFAGVRGSGSIENLQKIADELIRKLNYDKR